MFFTIIAGVMIAQILNPFVVGFEYMVSLESALIRRPAVSEPPARVNKSSMGPVLTGRASIVIDRGSRRVLWADGQYLSFPIASISKLMTALVFLETKPDLSEYYTLSSEDMTKGGSVYVKQGDAVRVRDMLYSALIASDNNSAQGLIGASGLSKEEFINRMNVRASEIGMLHSSFQEVTGLSFTNVSSVQDVALLLDEALRNPVINDAVSRKSYEFTSQSGNNYKLYNTNKLLGSYLDVIGGKTGFNNEARYNLAVAIRGEDEQELLVVVLGSKSIDSRFRDAKILADWAFRNYSWN